MKKFTYKNQQGFTIVETMIYVALFAIIMSGAIVSIYGIIGSSSRNATKAMVQEEGTFLIGKIDYILNGKQTATIDHTGSTWILSVAKSNGTQKVNIKIVDGGNMSIDKGSGYIDLNNSNITVICGATDCFTHTTASADGINPESIGAEFTVITKTSEGLSYSQEFSTIKYLRK